MAKHPNPPPKAAGGDSHLPPTERAKRRAERAKRRLEADQKSDHSVSDRTKEAAKKAEEKAKQPSQPARSGLTTASKLPGGSK